MSSSRIFVLFFDDVHEVDFYLLPPPEGSAAVTMAAVAAAEHQGQGVPPRLPQHLHHTLHAGPTFAPRLTITWSLMSDMLAGGATRRRSCTCMWFAWRRRARVLGNLGGAELHLGEEVPVLRPLLGGAWRPTPPLTIEDGAAVLAGEGLHLSPQGRAGHPVAVAALTHHHPHLR